MWPVGHRLDLPACQSRSFLLRADINHRRIKCQNLNFQRGSGLIYNFFIQDVMMHHYTHNWFDIEFDNTKHLASLPWWPMRTISEAGTNYPLEEQQMSLWSINMSSPLPRRIFMSQKSRDKGIMGGVVLMESQLFFIYLSGVQWVFLSLNSCSFLPSWLNTPELYTCLISESTHENVKFHFFVLFLYYLKSEHFSEFQY